MELSEFITARLDEEEDAVLDLTRGHPGPWSVDGCQVRDAAGETVVYDEHHWTPMQHIARHDPARVLREVEAKRAHVRAWERIALGFTTIGETEREFAAREALEAVLEADAAIWSDHPDYDPQWHA